MNMFCYQCQETGNRKGCTNEGICGKTDETANLQDVLIYSLKGLAYYMTGNSDETIRREAGMLSAECLFATVTNTNFDPARIVQYIKRVQEYKAYAKKIQGNQKSQGTQESSEGQENGEGQTTGTILSDPNRLLGDFSATFPVTENALWEPESDRDIYNKSLLVGVLMVKDPDERSLRETIVYGLKGLSAYTYHAGILGFYDPTVFDSLFELLYKTSIPVSLEELMELVFKTGDTMFRAMKILDEANSKTYGIPQPVLVRTGVGILPGILVSGHELKDLEMLLDQSEGKGVDIYTNGEMILAQYLPFFKKYPHLKGNYGNAWWQQPTEFEKFNGAVLVTSNCIVPPEKSYVDRLYTTSVAGYPGVKHITEMEGNKDFSGIIEAARICKPPEDLHEPDFVAGFNHQYLAAMTDKIVDGIRAGKIKKFVVMAGCDGRDSTRKYYTEKALSLDEGSIILTAGCAKYRYIKKVRGDIDGIPKVLDAGQCSDTYTILAFALHLMKVFGIEDINDLPVEIDMAWYDQKALGIFLTLLQLGIKKIKIGPTLPEYINQYILGHLPEEYEISTVVED